MSTHSTHATPYPDVNAVLDDLLSSAHTILRNNFVGMYLHGSLAAGDFEPDRSDIDFLIVTTDEISDETFSALQAMHARIAASESKWATELEGAYIPQRVLRRYDPANARHPTIGRHKDAYLRVEQHDSDWVIKRHVLREQGIVLTGPPPHTLIDPIQPNELRRAVLETLRGWWTPMLDDPTRLQSPGYRAFAILTMCRMLYTLQYGTIVSKPFAARWALAPLDERWIGLIEWAMTWQPGKPADTLNETLDIIRYTLERRITPSIETDGSTDKKSA